MKEITPETLIEMGKEMEDIFLAGLPVEKLLKTLTPEERLEGLKPEERLEGLKPEEIETLFEAYRKKIKTMTKSE